MARPRWIRCGHFLIIPDFWMRLRIACGKRWTRCRRIFEEMFKSFIRRTAFRLPWRRAAITRGSWKRCGGSSPRDWELRIMPSRRIVSERLGITNHALAYQSRSGAPGQPWLEPDVLDHLREVKSRGLAGAVVLAPIGFISDHMEVLYDLDVEARELADSISLPMVRAKTVGVHRKFVGMIRELILERMDPALPRLAVGSLGTRRDFCAEDCCPAPRRGGG